MIEINIKQPDTWPADVLDFFNRNTATLSAWAKPSSYSASVGLAKDYDRVIKELQPIISKYYLRGYHCTRLTDGEIETIKKNGMHLPDSDKLQERVERLIAQNVLKEMDAKELLKDNEAAEPSRKDRLWFTFFPPKLASEHGIGRFFRSWGGEALYNSHESNAVTGQVLQGIGTPCIIEALLPIDGFQDYSLPIRFTKEYMRYAKITNDRLDEYEGDLKVPLNPENIAAIHLFPGARFSELSGCDNWRQPLSL